MTHGFPEQKFSRHTLADLDTPEEALDASLGIAEKLFHSQADDWEPCEHDAMERSRR